ncbi:MAG TPA: HDOD domain-containing protein [Kofleriaceae bacterium]|nr:HDOD domain-containing protein [Kofleriaceae bacterium]
MDSASSPTTDRPTSKDPVLVAVLRLIAEDAVKVPPIPTVVAQLSQKLADPACEMRGVAALVGTDQALSAHVLRCAGATLLATRAQVASLTEAVMRVGTNGLFSLSVSFCLGREVARRSPLQSLRRDVFRQAATTAEFCRRLAPAQKLDPDSGFLIGLLGSFGLNVALGAIEQVLSQSNANPGRPAAEWMEMARRCEESIAVGVITQWGMPKLVGDVIAARRTGQGDEKSLAYAALVQAADRLTELFCSTPTPTVAEIAAAVRCSEQQAAEISTILPGVAAAVLAIGSAGDDLKASRPIATPVVEAPPTTLKGQLVTSSIPVTVERKGGDQQLMCTGMTDDGFVAQGTQPLPLNQVVKCRMLGVDEDLDLVAFVAAVALDGEYRFEMKPMGLVAGHARKWQKLRGDAASGGVEAVEVLPSRPDLAVSRALDPASAHGAAQRHDDRQGGVSLHAGKGSPLRRIGGWLRGGRGETD